MGFYLRKSLKVGPFRFNLSKSGIGVSTGIKGFRLGTGPRGNYVHMGRHGLYYRATIPSTSPTNRKSVTYHEREIFPKPPMGTHEPLHEIDSGDVLQMQDSSSNELLQEINLKRKKVNLWPLPFILSIIFLIVAPANNVPDWLIAVIFLFLIIITIFVYYKDQIRKTTVLLYDLEPSIEESYQTIHNVFDELSHCDARWHITAEGNVRDRKYHGGASKLLQRKPISVSKGQPPFVKTNLSIPILPVGRQSIYFFPDRLLIFASNGVGAISYNSLNLDVYQARFIEEERVPHDSEIVDRTWKYVNKNGGPDRRFSNNREIPIVNYEEMRFTSSSGLNEIIQISKVGIGSKLNKAILAIAKCCQTTNQTEKEPHNTTNSQVQHKKEKLFNNLSDNALRLISDKPNGWEYKLLFQVWVDEIDFLSDKLIDYKHNLKIFQSESLGSENAIEWIRLRLIEMSGFIEKVNNLVNIKAQEVFNPTGEIQVDEKEIVFVAKNIVKILDGIIDWCNKIRIIRSSEPIKEVLEVLVKMPESVIDNMQNFPKTALDQIEKALQNTSEENPQELVLTFTFELSHLDEFYGSFERAEQFYNTR